MIHSRRDLMRAVAGVSTVPAFWSAFSGTLQAAATAADPDRFWELVRRQFPLQESLTYLNAANVCPASRLVLDRYLNFLRDFHSNPSFQNREKYKPMYEQLRTKLAGMLAVAADEVAITRNTSEGTNIIVEGIELQRGDEVVITEHNHPSNNDSWKVRARRIGFEIRSIPVAIPARSKEDLIATFDKAITPRTKVVALTHVTSTTGILYPAREIAELAHKRNAWVHLDGAQSFGLLKLNLRELGCDSYSGSAHKWMMGPLEAGVLYLRADKIGRIWPSIVTAGWSDELIGARKFEVLGQRDDPRVVSLEAAVDFYNLVGPDRIEARTRQLAGQLKAKLATIPNLRMKTNLEPELSAGVVKFQPTKRGTQETYDQIWSRHRIAMAITPAGDAQGLRLSPHIYNSTEEVERAVDAVRECLAS
jgi:isopenicillin-N epimerase